MNKLELLTEIINLVKSEVYYVKILEHERLKALKK
jgi:hypothetical protein